MLRSLWIFFFCQVRPELEEGRLKVRVPSGGAQGRDGRGKALGRGPDPAEQGACAAGQNVSLLVTKAGPRDKGEQPVGQSPEILIVRRVFHGIRKLRTRPERMGRRKRRPPAQELAGGGSGGCGSFGSSPSRRESRNRPRATTRVPCAAGQGPLAARAASPSPARRHGGRTAGGVPGSPGRPPVPGDRPFALAQA